MHIVVSGPHTRLQKHLPIKIRIRIFLYIGIILNVCDLYEIVPCPEIQFLPFFLCIRCGIEVSSVSTPRTWVKTSTYVTLWSGSSCPKTMCILERSWTYDGHSIDRSVSNSVRQRKKQVWYFGPKTIWTWIFCEVSDSQSRVTYHFHRNNP